MAEKARLEELLARLADLKDRAGKASRLAMAVSEDDHARRSMLAYADELDRQEQDLAAQIGVLKQEAVEAAADVEQPIAALKLPEPEAGPT